MRVKRGREWVDLGPGSAARGGITSGASLDGNRLFVAAHVDALRSRTVRQAEILEAVQTAGSVHGAARALGISRAAVYDVLERMRRAA